MKKIDYPFIKSELEIMRCPYCNKFSKITLIDNDSDIEIDSCCDNFQSTLIERAGELIAKHFGDDFLDNIKGIG